MQLFAVQSNVCSSSLYGYDRKASRYAPMFVCCSCGRVWEIFSLVSLKQMQSNKKMYPSLYFIGSYLDLKAYLHLFFFCLSVRKKSETFRQNGGKMIIFSRSELTSGSYIGFNVYFCSSFFMRNTLVITKRSSSSSSQP